MRTTTWEFKATFQLAKMPQMKPAGSKYLRDIFAVWYSVTEPRVPGRAEIYEFGYNQVYNGIGVFLYQYDDQLRLIARQDLGVERVELKQMNKKEFKEGVSGCIIRKDQVNWQVSKGTYGAFQIILGADQGNLRLSYLNDRHEVVECFSNQHFSNLSYQGYFGVSARNVESAAANFDAHLKSIRITNYDPTKYRRNEDLFTTTENMQANSEIVELRNALGFTDEEFLEELAGPDSSLVFTDELKSDAADLLKKYADQMKGISKFLQSNLGNILETDEEAETLYKMHEHVKHVTKSLSRLNEEEELFSRTIKQFSK